MIHQLKTEQEYYKAVVKGIKTFEIRDNDRNFIVGDILGLNEIVDGKETGNCTLVVIDYILSNSFYFQKGYVALGISRLSIINSRVKYSTENFILGEMGTDNRR